MIISVVTPTKNSERYILETLESIHGQGYPDLEHIIVDGGSTDRTVDIIKRFIVTRKCEDIRLIIKEDENMYEAINTGFKLITGDICAYLNSDDCYLDSVFEIISSNFERHKDVDMIYGNCEYVNEQGNTLFWSNNPTFNFNRLVRTGTAWIQQPGIFIRKRVLENVGYFDLSYELASDYDYLLRIGKSCSVLGIKDVVVKFRVHAESLSSTKTNDMFKEARQIRCNYQKGSPVIIRMQTVKDYLYIYCLLIRPRNFRYIVKKLFRLVKYPFLPSEHTH